MTNDVCLEAYQDFLIQTRNASENTRSSYLRDLRQLTQWLPCSLMLADSSQLTKYIVYLKTCGKSAATISRNVASIKNFYKFLMEEHIIDVNPAVGLNAEKAIQKAPDILTSREVELLLDQPQCVDLKGYRDKAMLEVLYSSGIRVSELISLQISDVDLQRGMLRRTSKDKIREITLSASAIKALSEYVLYIREQMLRSPQEETLFVNVNGTPMSRQGFWKLLKSYQLKAGIEKNITPHTLRHSFAAHLLQKGTNVHDIQHIMGHSDVSTTNHYAHMFLSSKT